MMHAIRCLAFILSCCCAGFATAAPDGEALQALVSAYSAIGSHRTGTPEDERTVAWFAQQLRERGATVSLEPFAFDRYDARAEVRIDGQAVPSLALYYEGEGELQDVQPFVAAASALDGDRPAAALQAAIAQARAAGAKVAVVATLNEAGELQVPNRAAAGGSGLPVVLVPGRLAEALKAGTVRVDLSARSAPARSHNVVAAFGDVSRSPIVIATPLSCWFACAGERGTGIALAIALAAHLAPRHPVLVVGSPGHELLPHVGLQAFLREHRIAPAMVLHLGANVALGQPGPEGRMAFAPGRVAGLRMGPGAAARLKPALESMGLKVYVNPPRWLGEGALWAEATAAPMLSIVGAGPLFHTPADTPERATSPALMAQAFAALSGLLDTWLQVAPLEMLARLKPEVKPFSAQEIDRVPTGDCFWVGAVSPGTFNILYPDEGVTYYGAQYRLPAGASLSLEGRFPHARHMSINAYDAQGQPLDRIVDVLVDPLPGGTNPFRPGARRDAAARGWRVQLQPRELVAGQPVDDATRPPGTLYLPQGEPLTQLWYRIYLPDQGRDATGGAGLPRPVLTLAGGHRLDGEALCRAIVVKDGAVRDIRVPAEPLKAMFALPSTAPFHPAQAQPRWNAFFNPALGVASLLIGTPYEAARSRMDATRRGGFYGTLDNTYLSMYVDDRYGDVLVLTGRAPSTPRTLGGERVMQAADLRYWSVCKYRSLADTAVDACLNDEQVPRDAQGRYTIVVSPPERRPSNARRECGVAWLPWGSGDALGNAHGGFLLMRQMLPSAAFRPSSAFATRGPGDEQQVLGAYYPEPGYVSRAAFEAQGCPAAGDVAGQRR